MRQTRSLEIKVGIVSIVAIILLVLGISLGKNVRFAPSGQQITMEFPGSGGIIESAPVVINGVKRGDVTSVKNKNGGVIITAEIDDISDLHADATARITMLEITGGKKIEIKPGNAQEMLDYSDVIKGTTAADISDLVTLLGDISGDAVNVVKKLDTILTTMADILDDEEFISNLKNTAKNADNLTSNLNDFYLDNENQLRTSIDNVAEITHELNDAIKKNRPDIEKIVTKLDTAITKTNRLLTKADITVDDARVLIENLDKIAKTIESGDGLASKLINDKEFAEDLAETLAILKQFIEKVNEHGVNVNARLGGRP